MLLALALALLRGLGLAAERVALLLGLGLWSVWTKKYKPRRVVSAQEGGKALELAVTASLMCEKGYKNVRGASWCRLEMKEPAFLLEAKDWTLGREEPETPKKTGPNAKHRERKKTRTCSPSIEDGGKRSRAWRGMTVLVNSPKSQCFTGSWGREDEAQMA